MGFYSFLDCKTDKSIPAYPWAEMDREYSEVVMVLPDDKTIYGVYDGYGNIEEDDGTCHDIYDLIAPYYFNDESATRDDIFSERKYIKPPGGKEVSINQFNWEEPIGLFAGQNLNQLRRAGYTIDSDFDRSQSLIKILRQSNYAGEKFSDLQPSKSCPDQGYFYEDDSTVK